MNEVPCPMPNEIHSEGEYMVYKGSRQDNNHLLLHICIWDFKASNSVFLPFSGQRQEAHSRKPFWQVFQNREDINEESSRKERPAEIDIGPLDEGHKLVLSVLNFVSVGDAEDYVTSQSSGVNVIDSFTILTNAMDLLSKISINIFIVLDNCFQKTSGRLFNKGVMRLNRLIWSHVSGKVPVVAVEAWTIGEQNQSVIKPDKLPTHMEDRSIGVAHT